MKTKTKEDKIVEAHPQITFLSEIQIKDKEATIDIGGFTLEGGLVLKSPYELVKDDERKGILNGDLTYYNFVKSSNKMCEQEKAWRKIEADKGKWKKKREKELEEELRRLKENKKDANK